jgi:MoxR-like ATPase
MFKIYRLEEKARILAALKANGSILLCGDEGSGKTVLLDSVREDLTAGGDSGSGYSAANADRHLRTVRGGDDRDGG